MTTNVYKPCPELLAMAETCGAKITGKPDGSEPISIVFTPEAWRMFSADVQRTYKPRSDSLEIPKDPVETEPTPFDEGFRASGMFGATWFDCPYTTKEFHKQREWLRGWDEYRKRHYQG